MAGKLSIMSVIFDQELNRPPLFVLVQAARREKSLGARKGRVTHLQLYIQ